MCQRCIGDNQIDDTHGFDEDIPKHLVSEQDLYELTVFTTPPCPSELEIGQGKNDGIVTCRKAANRGILLLRWTARGVTELSMLITKYE